MNTHPKEPKNTEQPRITKESDDVAEDVRLRTVNAMSASASPAAVSHWNEWLEKPEVRRKMNGLRQEIIQLQAPGELYRTRRESVETMNITAGYGDESWDTGRSGSFTKTSYYLITGARKTEIKGIYGGGFSFPAPEPQLYCNLTWVRYELLTQRQKKLDELLLEVRENPPIPAASDLAGITPAEWLAQFNRQLDEQELELRIQWESEDSESHSKMLDESREYNALAQELVHAREKLKAVDKRAWRSAVMLEEDMPEPAKIGVADAETLRKSIEEIHQYIPKAEKMIETKLLAREEGRKAEEAERKAEAEKRREEAVGRSAEAGDSVQMDSSHEIDPKELEYAEIGTTLAKAAEKKLGAPQAIEFLNGEFNAGYGRARRQQTVSERLGTPIDDNLRKFYNYSKARDVDSVLEAALDYLQNTTPKAQAVAPKEAAKPVKTSVPSKTSPVKPANMADLMGRFGKKTR